MKGFSLNNPPPSPNLSGNSSQASYIYLNFWPLSTPQTPREISNPFRGESMDISETTDLLRVFERILATRQYSVSENMI